MLAILLLVIFVVIFYVFYYSFDLFLFNLKQKILQFKLSYFCYMPKQHV